MNNFKINNFQIKNWRELLETDLPKAVESCSVVDANNGVSISYQIENLSELAECKDNYTWFIKNKKSLKTLLKVKVKVDVTGEQNYSTTKTIPVLDVPIMSDAGLIINGQRYEIVSSYRRSYGWVLDYQEPKSDENKDYEQCLTLQLRTERGGMIEIFYNNKGLVVARNRKSAKKGTKSKYVPIAVFLKAMTGGLTYKEMLTRIGGNNPRLTEAFSSKNELSYEDCLKIVAKDIFGCASSEINPKEYINDLICNPRRFYLGKEHKSRFEKWVSYDKCVGFSLAEDTLTYKADQKITAEMASEFNRNKVDEIVIIGDNNDTHKVLRFDAGDNLCGEELLVVMNYLSLAYDRIVDDVDSLENKVLEPLSQKVTRSVIENLEKFSGHIIRKLEDGGISIEDIINIDSTGCLIKPQEYDEDGIARNTRRDNIIAIDSLIKSIVQMNETQIAEETNIMATISKGYKINASGKSAPKSARDIKPSQYGRVCPIESPEGSKIGLTTTMTVLSGVNEDGFVTTPYIDLKTGKRVEYSALDEIGKYIVATKVDLTSEGKVPARLDGENVMINPKDADLQEVSPLQVISPVVACIPCMENDYGKRSLMAANMTRQALTPFENERAFVATGVDSVIEEGIKYANEIYEQLFNLASLKEEDYEECYHFPIKIASNRLSSGSRELVYFCTAPKLKDVKCTVRLPYHQGTVKQTSINWEIVPTKNGCEWYKDEIILKLHDIVTEDCKLVKDSFNYGIGMDISADQIKKKAIGLGTNRTILFKMHEGFGYEDAVIVSSDLVEKEKLSVVSILEKRVELSTSVTGVRSEEDFKNCKSQTVVFEELTGTPLNIPMKEIEHLNSKGLPKVGSYLASGDILVGKNRITYTRDKVDKGSVVNHTVKSSCERLKTKEQGYVINVTESIEDGNTVIYITLGNVKHLEKGDKMTGRHGNKGVIARVVPKEDMPYLADGTVADMILNPLGVPSRMNIGQLVEHALGLITMKTGTYHVLPPFMDNNLEYCINQLQQNGLKETEIYDGRTGRKFPRKMMMGSM